MSRLPLILSLLIFSVLFYTVNPTICAQDAASGDYTGFWYERKNGKVQRIALEGEKYEEMKRKELTEYWTPMFRTFLDGNIEAYAENPERPVTAAKATQMIKLDAKTAQYVESDLVYREEMAKQMAEWSLYYDQLELWNEYVAQSVIRDELDEDEKITYNPATIKTDLELIYDSLQSHAEEAVNDEKQRQEKMLTRIENNRINLQLYNNWLDDRESDVLKYARRWARQYEGEELNFDGTTYLVRETHGDDVVTDSPRSDTVIINKPVEQKGITPFDLLNEDGTLIKPE